MQQHAALLTLILSITSMVARPTMPCLGWRRKGRWRGRQTGRGQQAMQALGWWACCRIRGERDGLKQRTRAVHDSVKSRIASELIGCRAPAPRRRRRIAASVYRRLGNRFLDDHLGDTGWTFRRQQLDVAAAMNICSGKGFSSSESTSQTL